LNTSSRIGQSSLWRIHKSNDKNDPFESMKYHSKKKGKPMKSYIKETMHLKVATSNVYIDHGLYYH
jgi:hypothetical protein